LIDNKYNGNLIWIDTENGRLREMDLS
jgi:hypothetical protein